MGLTLKPEETPTAIILTWLCDTPKLVLKNPNGVTHEHTTAVVQGSVEFRFGDKTIPMRAGEEIVLPVGQGYDVVGLEVPIEVRCTYPKDAQGTADSVAHLTLTGEREFPTFEDKHAIPRSDTVVTDDVKPSPTEEPAPLGVFARSWASVKSFFTA